MMPSPREDTIHNEAQDADDDLLYEDEDGLSASFDEEEEEEDEYEELDASYCEEEYVKSNDEMNALFGPIASIDQASATDQTKKQAYTPNVKWLDIFSKSNSTPAIFSPKVTNENNIRNSKSPRGSTDDFEVEHPRSNNPNPTNIHSPTNVLSPACSPPRAQSPMKPMQLEDESSDNKEDLSPLKTNSTASSLQNSASSYTDDESAEMAVLAEETSNFKSTNQNNQEQTPPKNQTSLTKSSDTIKYQTSLSFEEQPQRPSTLGGSTALSEASCGNGGDTNTNANNQPPLTPKQQVFNTVAQNINSMPIPETKPVNTQQENRLVAPREGNQQTEIKSPEKLDQQNTAKLLQQYQEQILPTPPTSSVGDMSSDLWLVEMQNYQQSCVTEALQLISNQSAAWMQKLQKQLVFMHSKNIQAQSEASQLRTELNQATALNQTLGEQIKVLQSNNVELQTRIKKLETSNAVPAEKKRIVLLKRLQKTSFNQANIKHQALLVKLCKNLNLDYTNVNWKIVGFDSNNPGSELGEAGMLGLQNLVYFTEEYSSIANQIIHDQPGYSMAKTGLLITVTLTSIFHTDGIVHNSAIIDAESKAQFIKLIEQRKVFEEIYCFAFRKFDKAWRVRTGDADRKQQAHAATASMRLGVAELLSHNPRTLGDVFSYCAHLLPLK